jgi:ATP-dependent RNA helicase RhlE
MTNLEHSNFKSLHLIDPLLNALDAEGYTEPTPIQSQAIPHVLKGRDLLACAQTGTGKTAAFALPILQLLSEHSPAAKSRSKIRTLILTPTRELAAQIGESFKSYGRNLDIYGTVIFGGVGQGSQVSAIKRGVDILVATPGRLLDLVEQKLISLDSLEIFVLDEADRMLDMGFINDVKRVIKLIPKKRQTLFFSATMPRDILHLANDILTDPVKVEVTPVATTAEKISQAVYFVEGLDTKRLLLEHIFKDKSVSMALVFTRTKHGADRVSRFLNSIGVPTESIHGNKSQNNRVRALDNFKKGKIRCLVATDIAARGIDIDGVSHVINFEFPNVPETYVHRIGRTARAGAEGISLSFCDQEEREYLRDVEKLTRQKIPVIADHPFVSGVYIAPPRPAAAQHRARHPQQRRNHNTSHSTSRNNSRNRPHSRNEHRGPNQNRPSSSAGAARPKSRHPSHARGPARPGRPHHAAHTSKPRAPVTPRKVEVAPAPPEKKKSWWKKLIDTE